MKAARRKAAGSVRGGSSVLLLSAGALFAATLAAMGVAANGLTGGSGVAPGTPAAKSAELQREADVRAAAAASAPPKGSFHAPLDAGEQGTRVSGVFSQHDGPFASSSFSVQNSWSGLVGARWLVVYAGTSHQIGDQGALAVYSEPSSLSQPMSLSEVGIFEPSPSCVSLTITSVSGTILALSTDSGLPLLFDVTSDTFTR